MGKTFVPFRTTISSCQVNRKRGGVLRPTSDSQNGVNQAGGRVARHPRLGPGRHILVRQYDSMPVDHEPAIHEDSLHRVVLRLIRDRLWGRPTSGSWLAGEEPSSSKLQAAFKDLLEHGCVEFNTLRRAWLLSETGKQMLSLPTNYQHSLLLLKAQKTNLLGYVCAAVAFLESAEGGSFEKSRGEQSQTIISRLCGAREFEDLEVQDDLLRFANYTFLACEFEHLDILPLAKQINVLAMVLRRAVIKYRRLEGHLRPWVSLRLVKIMARWINSQENEADLLNRVAQMSPMPIADGSSSVGARLADFYAKVLPTEVSIVMMDGKVYQSGTGANMRCNISSDSFIIPLLARHIPWMQKKTTYRVDAHAKYCAPLVRTSDVYINRLALYSDSTLSTELGNNLDQVLVSHMRTLSPDLRTLEVTIKGQYPFVRWPETLPKHAWQRAVLMISSCASTRFQTELT